jgi:hypothetical protein
LHDEIGSRERRARVVQEPPQEGGRQPERHVADDAEWFAGQGHLQDVAFDDDGILATSEPATQDLREARIEFDRNDAACRARQRLGDPARSRTDLEDELVFSYSELPDDLTSERAAPEEVLTARTGCA